MGVAVVQFIANLASGWAWVTPKPLAPAGRVLAARTETFGNARFTLSGLVNRDLLKPAFGSSIPLSSGTPVTDRRENEFAKTRSSVAPPTPILKSISPNVW